MNTALNLFVFSHGLKFSFTSADKEEKLYDALVCQREQYIQMLPMDGSSDGDISPLCLCSPVMLVPNSLGVHPD